jgi:hypothetical protein
MFVDVEIIGLQKTFKLVSLCLETQAATTPLVRDCRSECGRRDHRLKEMA